MIIGTAKLKTFDTSVAFKELNLLVSDIAEGGIINANRHFTPSISNGIVTISPGAAIFNGGTCLKVTEATTFEATEGLVCVAYNASTRSGGLYLSNTPPRGEYIPICEISNGNITDLRVRAKYKIAKNGGNEFVSCTLNGCTTERFQDKSTWVELAKYEMKRDFEEAIIHADEDIWRCVQLVDGADSSIFSLKIISRTDSDERSCKGKISRSNRTLTFWARPISTSNSSTDWKYPKYALYSPDFYLI